MGSSPVVQWINDPALPLLWFGFLWTQPKKKKKKNTKQNKTKPKNHNANVLSHSSGGRLGWFLCCSGSHKPQSRYQPSWALIGGFWGESTSKLTQVTFLERKHSSLNWDDCYMCLRLSSNSIQFLETFKLKTSFLLAISQEILSVSSGCLYSLSLVPSICKPAGVCQILLMI